MNQNDAAEFYGAMDLACGMLSKKVFDESVLKGYFSLLMQYPITDIKASLNALICSSDSQYGIRPDLIIKYMGIKEVKTETIEGILAKSKAKNTPLGIVASRAIKTWDHDNLQPFALRQKAAEFLELLPNIEKDIQELGYSDETLRLLLKYEVDPTSDFRDGVSGPKDDDQTRLQYKKLMIEDKRREDAQERNRLIREREMAEENAHSENDLRNDRAARPEIWAEVDKLNSEGKKGEALRLLYPELFPNKHRQSEKQAAIDSDKAVFNEMMNKEVK